MIRFLFILMAGLISFSAQAQRIINGQVVDGTGTGIPGVTILLKGTNKGVQTDQTGTFKLSVPQEDISLVISFIGYNTQEVKVKKGSNNFLKITLAANHTALNEVVVTGYAAQRKASMSYSVSTVQSKEIKRSRNNNVAAAMQGRVAGLYATPSPERHNDEAYSDIQENKFHNVKDQPLSTFSIDVDRAAYANVRRFLNQGQLPPADAVRVEEMINYFDYQYKAPTGKDPVAIYADIAVCPWETSHQLVRVALKGREVANDQLPPSNLVFLIDVSGSMWDANKLPLVKQALKALVQQLRQEDKVAIVVYAGAAGVVLPSTPGSEKTRILDALEKLQAGGSTAGGEGIKLAYNTAAESFLQHGNNRVIMATDGDFNVGISSNDELEKLITKEREKGIFLSVLGFGMGNYKDNKLETLADKGNGNYAYIDNFEEARRIFVTEFGGTLFTIAKDVKLQLEFNPQYIQSYRLIGYENRMLANEDFNDDKKDAGEMGAGHTVTALYEIVPAKGKGVKVPAPVDALKYQETKATNNFPDEALTVKLRYKEPASKKSQLISQVLPWAMTDIKNAPEDFRMAAAVAGLGLLLRDSEFKGKATYKEVISLATGAKGDDNEGYRAEFIKLAKTASLLNGGEKAYSGNIPADEQ